MDDEENRSDGDGGRRAHGVAPTVGRILTAAVRVRGGVVSAIEDLLRQTSCPVIFAAVFFSRFYAKNCHIYKPHPSPQKRDFAISTHEIFPSHNWLKYRVVQNEQYRVARNLCLPVPGWLVLS